MVLAGLGWAPNSNKRNIFFHFSLQNMKSPQKTKNRIYFGGPPSQFSETRRLFLDFVLSKIN
jgi:hypothetical protein